MNVHSLISRNKRTGGIDRVFLVLVLVELVFGAIMLASASGPSAYRLFGSSWHYVGHQLWAGVLPGLIGLFVLARIDHRRWEKLAPFIIFIGLASMLLVFVPGLAAQINAAKSWIVIGGRFSYQPTEFLKLAFIIYLAALFSGKGSGGSGTRTARQAFVPAAVCFIAAAVLLMLQPDLGSLLLIAAVFFIMVFSAGIPFTYLAGVALAGGAAFLFFAKSAPYRAARLTVFLHPELDPQGIGYQINQALLAIGSGGLLGFGLGHSRQKFSYLPEVMSDSIFPIIVEELGFLFALGLIVLIVAIFIRGLAIARNADPFGRLLVIGIMSWFAIQSFLNIGAMLSLLPLTGLPLPFVSYGGTAMAVGLWSIGIVLSVSRGNSRT